MNEHTLLTTKAILKGLIAAGEVTYDKAIQTGIQTYNTETAQAVRSFVYGIYRILATRIDELEARANARWIEEWHGTILCTCRKCDKGHLWKTKQMRELKKSWL